MAYIGKTPVIGNFVKLDSITVVNGQAAYTMQNGGVNFTSYDNVNQFLVSLNGVLQAPTDSFTVSGSTLTFASNLSTGDVIDFVLVLGNSLDIGTPSDNTVSLAKLTATGTKDATTFLRGDNTFAEAGGGSLIKLATQSLSGDSAVSFDGYFSSTYKDYIVRFQNFKPSTNNSNFYFRARQSNADVTSSSYGTANLRVFRDDNTSDGSSVGGNNNTFADLLYNIGVSNGSEGGLSGDLIIHNPLETSNYKYITANYIFTQGDDTSKTISGISFVRFTANTNALSGFTLYFSVGNISSGTIQLYGVES